MCLLVNLTEGVATVLQHHTPPTRNLESGNSRSVGDVLRRLKSVARGESFEFQVTFSRPEKDTIGNCMVDCSSSKYSFHHRQMGKQDRGNTGLGLPVHAHPPSRPYRPQQSKISIRKGKGSPNSCLESGHNPVSDRPPPPKDRYEKTFVLYHRSDAATSATAVVIEENITNCPSPRNAPSSGSSSQRAPDEASDQDGINAVEDNRLVAVAVSKRPKRLELAQIG